MSTKRDPMNFSESSRNQILSTSDDPGGMDDTSAEDGQGDVQDNINLRVETLFPTFTSSDTLLQHEMLELLTDLGLDVTLAALQAYTNEDQYDLETAQDIAQHFFMALRNVNVGATTSTTVVHQSPWEYLKTAVACRRIPAHEYKVMWPKFEYQLSPRKILLGGTGVVMLLTGMLVITTVSLLWVDTETKREKKVSKSLGETVLSFSSLFERNWVELAGKEAASETDVFTQYSNRRSEVAEANSLKASETAARMFEKSIDHGYITNVQQRKLQLMEGRFKTLVKITEVLTSPTKTPAEVATANSKVLPSVRSWESSEWDIVVTTRDNVTIVEGAKEPCTAANTTGCSYQLDCLVNAKDSEVTIHMQSTDVHNRASQAISVYLPSLDYQVCALFRQSTIRDGAELYTNAAKAESNSAIAALNLDLGIARALVDNTIGDPKLTWNIDVDSRIFRGAPCLNSSDATACRSMDIAVGNAIVERKVNTSVLFGRGGIYAICSVVPTTFETAVAMCSKKSSLVSKSIGEVVEVINFLNFEFVRTTEIVASTINRTTNKVTAQVTAFRFAAGCYGECFRSPPSSVNAIAAFATGGTGFSITPDYRPEPVIGGYSYSPFLDVAVLIERDVHEVRQRADDTLIAILDEVNVRMKDVEVLAVRPVNYPPIKTFHPDDTCPDGIQCIQEPGKGVVYRADCSHCERLENDEIGTLDFLTEIKDPGNMCARNGGSTNCSNAYLSQFDVYRQPFNFRNVPLDQRSYDSAVFTGYTGEDMLSGYFYIDNVSLGVVVQWPTSTYEQPILVIVGLSVGVACLFVVIALVVLMLQSRRYLDDIEEEWSNYKRQISDENEKFAETVIEVLPAKVAQRLMKKSVVIAETHSLTHMFLSFAGFQRFIAGWEPPLIGQYTSYFFYLVTTVSLHYRIHKVRTIGDMTFVVGGLQDDRDGESLSKVTLRIVQAAAVIMQLTSFLYVHSPPKVPQLKSVAVTEKITDICTLRVGIHFGPCTMHVTQGVACTPNFDCVGPNVSMAWKLHQLAKGSTINVSSAVKEALERRDAMDSFKFDKGRNVMHKKIVLQASLITHANVAVPASVLQALAIRRANPRTYFVDGGLAYQSADQQKEKRNHSGMGGSHSSQKSWLDNASSHHGD